MRETIIKFAKKLKSKDLGIFYVIRYTKTGSTYMSFVNDKLDKLLSSKDEGLASGCFSQEGYMGFATTNICDNNSIDILLENTRKSMSIARENNFEKVVGWKCLTKCKNFTDNSELFDEQFKRQDVESFILDIYKKIKAIYSEKSYSISLNSFLSLVKKHKLIINSNNIVAEYAYPYTQTGFMLTITKNSLTQSYYVSKDAKLWEIFNSKTEIIDEFKNVKSRLLNWFDAKKVEPGKYNLILDGSVASVFVHEAFGHTAESDTIKLESPLARNGKIRKGEKFTKSYINIYDETIKQRRSYTPIGEYGNVRNRTDIIKNGRINDFLSDLSTYDEIPNATERIESFDDIPISRMACTVLSLSGNTFDLINDPQFNKVQDIYQELLEKNVIKKTEKYLYLINSGGGTVLAQIGTFQFSSSFTYELYMGKTMLYKGVSFGGKTLSVLNAIKKGSKSMYTFSGDCSRLGQYVPVYGMAPRMLILKEQNDIIVN